jgi:DNA-binding LacI/PurR family transcriptional regulator
MGKKLQPSLADQRRPTSYDVAARAGVSQSAVSRCFKAGASVAPHTRARVLEAAQALGYQPNAFARGLITRRTNLVAVLISNLTNLYYPEVLAELTQRLSDKGIRVLLFSLPAEGDVDAILDQIWQYRVDGAIAAVRLTDAQIDQFHTNRAPLVLYNRVSGSTPCASVCCDSVDGERRLVDGLVASGYKEFGIVAGPEDSFVGQERLRGALSRLADHGFHRPPVVRGAFSYDSGREGLRRLMAAETARPDAVICANDVMAIGAIDAARYEFGLNVPEQMGVVGFDGVGPAVWSSYRVTTVRQPVRRMTEAAVAMLLERIANPDLEAERRLFAGQVIEGGSARLR